jgi:hypothetical protein
MALMSKLGQAWPPGGDTIPKTLNYSGKVLELSFAALDESWLGQLKAAGAAHALAITVDKGEAGQVLLRIRSVTSGGRS